MLRGAVEWRRLRHAAESGISEVGAATGKVPIWLPFPYVVWDAVAPCCCGSCVVSALDWQSMQLIGSHLRAECPGRKPQGRLSSSRWPQVVHHESSVGWKMRPGNC